MKPYYEHAGIRIFHCDCREVLRDLEPVDLVLTDPPYGIGVDAVMARTSCMKSGNGLANKGRYLKTNWDALPIDENLLSTVLDAGNKVCIFGGNYYQVPASPSWLVWNKMNGSTKFADCELAWTNYGGSVRMISHLWNGMLRDGGEKRNGHPTQKPLEVIRWAILQCPGEPQTILDPFMGSGTTLRAAKDLGIEATGVEIEERYAEMAAKRLAQEVLNFD